MKRQSRKSARAAAQLSADLMLAPMVATMRLPMLMAEARAFNPWRVETVRATAEKAGAIAEGMMAAQASLAYSALRFWSEAMRGQTPSLLTGQAIERAIHAALVPSGTRVRGNYRRLAKTNG